MSAKPNASIFTIDLTAFWNDEIEDKSTGVSDLQRHNTAGCSSISQSTCKCGHCGKVFQLKKTLENHEMYHKLTYSMKDICSKKFVNPRNLKRHAKTKHNVNQPFSCNYCSLRFGRIRFLQLHMMNDHSKEYNDLNEKPLSKLVQSSCQNSTTKPEPSNHPQWSVNINYEMIRVMILIKVRKKTKLSYICWFANCYKSFNTKAELYDHRSEEHNLSYICRYCHCTYRTDQSRKRHERKHALCATLTSGWETMHYDIAELTVTEHQDQKPVQCKYCVDKTDLKSISTLLRHMHNKHPTDVPKLCPCCKVWFEKDYKLMHLC